LGVRVIVFTEVLQTSLSQIGELALTNLGVVGNNANSFNGLAFNGSDKRLWAPSRTPVSIVQGRPVAGRPWLSS
jgi:hypothetical protein